MTLPPVKREMVTALSAAGAPMSAATVGAAAMAVATGQATTVVCWRALNARSEFRMGGTDRSAPTLVEFQYQVPHGLIAPPQQFAMAGRAYMAASPRLLPHHPERRYAKLPGLIERVRRQMEDAQEAMLAVYAARTVARRSRRR